VQIPDFLQVDAAERLRSCLQNRVPWSLSECCDGGSKTIAAHDYAATNATTRAEHLLKAYELAKTQFQFVFESYMMLKTVKEGHDPTLILHAILEFINSEEFISFARWLIGDQKITHANALATVTEPAIF